MTEKCSMYRNMQTQYADTQMRKRVTEAIAIGALPACQGQAIRVVEPASGCEWMRCGCEWMRGDLGEWM